MPPTFATGIYINIQIQLDEEKYLTATYERVEEKHTCINDQAHIDLALPLTLAD